MVDIENKYYQVSDDGQVCDDGLGSQPATSGHQLKVAMKPIALIGGSCLMLMFIVGTLATSPALKSSAAEITDLVGLSHVSRLPSGGVVKPGIINSRGAPVLPDSNSRRTNIPQHMRDVTVRHDDGGWDDLPEEIQAKEANRLLRNMKMPTATEMNDKEAALKAARAQTLVMEEDMEQKQFLGSMVFNEDGEYEQEKADPDKFMAAMAAIMLVVPLALVVNDAMANQS